MTRAFILVMDSFGIGGAADAAKYGDAGADTLGHIAAACATGTIERDGRRGPLAIPNLARLGLGRAAAGRSGAIPPGLESDGIFQGAFGHAAEISSGKDTPSGHWEIAGLPVLFDWGLFPHTLPCFPADFVDALTRACGLPGILGDCHASGTDIIRELGKEHIRTGRPICYTSADSLLQIAAHETHFGLQRLYDVCATAKALLAPLNIARVIARPFVGDSPDNFTRTANRRDLTTMPHGETLLDRLVASGRSVVAIGKIADIFAHRGISCSIAAKDNDALFDATLAAATDGNEDRLIFTNFVDFDMLYGHRRNVAGYAGALEVFDARLPTLEARLRPGDLVLITADHGCDPTWPGSDHTREDVPMLWFGPGVKAADLGRRSSFADMGQTIAGHFGLPALPYGEACF
jgi:phosphopentomutase